MMSQKVLSALVAVAIGLTGVITDTKWLTLVALGVWVAAMLLFGAGRRGGTA